MSKLIRVGVQITQYIEIEVPNNYDTDYRNPKHMGLVKGHFEKMIKGPATLKVFHCNRVKN